jgi:hypothetical protein
MTRYCEQHKWDSLKGCALFSIVGCVGPDLVLALENRCVGPDLVLALENRCVGPEVVLFGCFSKRLQLIRALPVLALYNKK